MPGANRLGSAPPGSGPEGAYSLIPHAASQSAARQAIIVRTSIGRSAKANAAAATGSPSRHMDTKRAATVAAHREATRANRKLTLPRCSLHALDLVLAAQHDH